MLEKLFGLKKNETTAWEVEQVTEALDRYDRIFRGSRGYGFLDWDLAAGITRWHGGFWTHLGYDESMIRKISRSERFIKFVHPDDRERFSLDIVKILKSKKNKDLIFRVLKRDGDFVWVELRLDAVRRVDGRVSHLSGVVFDVSELKKTEEALKISEARHSRIIQASNDGIWEWSAEDGGKFLKRAQGGGWVWSSMEGSFTFSARCWEMLGYEKGEEITGGDLIGWRSLMHEEDGKLFDKALMEHVVDRKPFDVEYRIRGKDGDWRWIRARGSMSHDKEGRPSMFSGSNLDITELKLAEERVMRTKEEAENASQAKSEFLSSMSHELRTPLNAILGFAQLLERDKSLGTKHQENVKEIRLAGEHLLELVGDVLDLAKIEAGRLQLHIERIQPARVINECAKLLKSPLESRGLSFEVCCAKLETCGILADSIRFKQVLLNLMSNAVKYNKSGGNIRVACQPVSHSSLRICVSDTGIGIPARVQDALFQPFNRLGAERSGIEGSGVGLVITKQLVQQMGGEIGFTSEEGVGSEFWVEFPIAKKDERAEEDADTQEEDEKDDAPDLLISSTKKVLYVEDNPSNQKLMEHVLDKFSLLDLTVVSLAVQGLYLARSSQPDLIILDVNLPGVNGYEMVEILKADPATSDIPVIALSANVLSHDIQKGKEAGFDHYLTKPLNLNELITVCNQLLSDAD